MAFYGAISSTSSFKTLGVMLSGPAALWGFSPVSSFLTPSSVMLMLGAVSYWPFILHRFLNCDSSSSSLQENACWNCAFRMLALSTESSCNRPTDFSSGMVFLSELFMFNVGPKPFHTVLIFV